MTYGELRGVLRHCKHLFYELQDVRRLPVRVGVDIYVIIVFVLVEGKLVKLVIERVIHPARDRADDYYQRQQKAEYKREHGAHSSSCIV